MGRIERSKVSIEAAENIEESSNLALEMDEYDDDSMQDEGYGSEHSGSSRQTVVYSCPVDHAGMALYVKGWLVENSEYPPVILIHDLGEHIGSYRAFASALNDLGVSVYAYDLRGHGRSGRILSQIQRTGDLVNDLLQVVAWIRHKEGGQAPILLGHGFGAQLVLRFRQSFPKMFEAAILAAPAFELKCRKSRFNKIVTRLLYEISPAIFLSSKWVSWLRSNALAASKDRGASSTALENLRLSASFLNELDHSFGPFVWDEVKGFSCLILVPEQSDIYNFEHYEKKLKHQATVQVEHILGPDHRLLQDSSVSLPTTMTAISGWLRAFRKNVQ
jgi:pimeloyl-ACP methyl ester carboxylesterase